MENALLRLYSYTSFYKKTSKLKVCVEVRYYTYKIGGTSVCQVFLIATVRSIKLQIRCISDTVHSKIQFIKASQGISWNCRKMRETISPFARKEVFNCTESGKVCRFYYLQRYYNCLKNAKELSKFKLHKSIALNNSWNLKIKRTDKNQLTILRERSIILQVKLLFHRTSANCLFFVENRQSRDI